VLRDPWYIVDSQGDRQTDVTDTEAIIILRAGRSSILHQIDTISSRYILH